MKLIFCIFVILFILIAVGLVVGMIYHKKTKDDKNLYEKISLENTNNIILKEKTINFNSLTLKQKIGQMVIVRGDNIDDAIFTKLNIGGIFLDRQKSKEGYIYYIKKYQDNSKIKLFVTTDMEGSWNPFSDFFYFPSFDKIESNDQAYRVGQEEGRLLKELGFNLNFAPVSEISDVSYGGRVFNGSKEEISKKIESYIKGLQENVYGTCKHYPGKGMIGNLHISKDKQNIIEEDLKLFRYCIKNNISAIMVGHQSVNGKINSNDKPSSVSKEVINSLENFSGLIISDEVNMQGLIGGYSNKVEMYKDLINSGENLILDFQLTPVIANELIDKISKKVESGEIDEGKINESVKKILMMKGYLIQ